MLDVARTTPSVSDSASIEWVEGSAQTLPFADGEFGVVVCQLGLQFFEDRRSALKELHRVLIPAGRIGASVYTSIDRNPAAFVLADVVDRHFGDDASRAKRSEHSLADPQELRDLFEAAGFGDVRIDTVTQIVRFRSVDEWVEIQLTATPLAALLADRDPAERERLVGAVRADVREGMADFASDNAFAFPQEVHVAVGSGYAAS
jgi:SAM-dependent methyltransferase